MTINIFALSVGLSIIGLMFVFTLISGSPPTPTSPRVRRAVLALLPRRLPAGMIYELGAGWGGNAIALATAFPDRTVIGVELSPLPWLVSRLRLLFSPRKTLDFRCGNFMAQELSDAALVVCYVGHAQMTQLQPKLAAEMAPGTLVLTHTFAMPDWRPVDTVQADDIYRSPVYLYEVPYQEPNQSSGADASASHDAAAGGSSPDS
jgi:hypothetical protein